MIILVIINFNFGGLMSLFSINDVLNFQIMDQCFATSEAQEKPSNKQCAKLARAKSSVEKLKRAVEAFVKKMKGSNEIELVSINEENSDVVEEEMQCEIKRIQDTLLSMERKEKVKRVALFILAAFICLAAGLAFLLAPPLSTIIFSAIVLTGAVVGGAGFTALDYFTDKVKTIKEAREKFELNAFDRFYKHILRPSLEKNAKLHATRSQETDIKIYELYRQFEDIFVKLKHIGCSLPSLVKRA